MGRRKEPDALFVDPAQSQTGQVYRDVCASIRASISQDLTDAALDAGLHAQARSLAGVIDRASGLAGRKQETYALAGLHRELGALLARVRGQAVASELDDFLRTLAEPDTAAGAAGHQNKRFRSLRSTPSTPRLRNMAPRWNGETTPR